MTDVNAIEETLDLGAPIVLVYGAPGLGKSTLGSLFPNTIFLDAEKRLRSISCKKIPINSYESLKDAIGALYMQEHTYSTVVIDTVDAISEIINSQFCQEKGIKSIEDIDYGKGWVQCLNLWQDIKEGLEALRSDKGMCVVLVAHSMTEEYRPPIGAAYTRHTIRMHKHSRAVLTDWADYILFADQKILASTEKLGFGKTESKALAGGVKRVLRTNHPGCVCKRSLEIPDEIPLDRDRNYFLEELMKAQELLTTKKD